LVACRAAGHGLRAPSEDDTGVERGPDGEFPIAGGPAVPAVASAASPSPRAPEPASDATPVAPRTATDPGDPDPVAESIAPPTPAPPSDRTSSDDAEDAGAETALPETAATTGPSEDTESAGRFAIQIGAYDREPQAAALAGRLAAKTYPAYVAESRDQSPPNPPPRSPTAQR